jgi:hypothetical protein
MFSVYQLGRGNEPMMLVGSTVPADAVSIVLLLRGEYYWEITRDSNTEIHSAPHGFFRSSVQLRSPATQRWLGHEGLSIFDLRGATLSTAPPPFWRTHEDLFRPLMDEAMRACFAQTKEEME